MHDMLFDTIEIGSVMLTDNGTVLILHIVACERCKSYGCAYINMSNVDRYDKLHETLCPLCREESLVLITYKILEEIRENTQGDMYNDTNEDDTND